MTYDKMIKKAINEKLTMSQGNYQVVYDKKTDQSHVYMFGNEIFIWDHEQKKHVYDFCGYIGYPKTTRAINYCLDAVGADFRVHTRKSYDGVETEWYTVDFKKVK